MSQRRHYTINCPQCRQDQEVDLFDSVNIGTDPELRDALLTNQLNALTCEDCGFAFRVDKPLLYHDPEGGFMVNLLPHADDEQEAGLERFSEWLLELNGMLPQGVEAPSLHLVFTRTELVERIFLLEAELDERVVEYIKYIIFSRNIERLNPREKVLLFNAEDSTEEALCFVVQDLGTRQLEEVLQYSREAYDGLCEMFDRDEQTPSLMELFPGPHVSARHLLLQDRALET